MADCEEELKGLFMTVKEESEKAGIKLKKSRDLGSHSHHFMANSYGNSDRLYFLRLPNHCRW